MNISRIQQQREEAKSKTYSYANKGSSYAFNILGLRNCEPGTYRMRIVWQDPVKNPEGMQLVSTSTVEATENGKKKAHRFLTPDMLGAGEGYHGVTEVLDHLEETGKFDALKEMGDSTKAIREAIKKLVPWRRYWMVVFIWAEEKPADKPNEYSTFVPVTDPLKPPLDRILEMNESIKLIDQLFSAFREFPDIDDVNTGRDVFIKVGKNRYDLEVSKETSRLEPALARFAAENYPDLPRLMRKFYFKAPGEIASLLQSQWWAKSLASAKVYFPDHEDKSLESLGNLGDLGKPKAQEEGRVDAPPISRPGSKIMAEADAESDPDGPAFDPDDKTHSLESLPPARPTSPPPARRPPPPPPRRS